MSVTIHPTAVVETGAELGANVTVGAMAYVGPNAVLHDNVTLHPKSTVFGRTLLNEHVEVFPGSVLGGPPQVLGYQDSQESRLEVGARTVMREHTTLHTGSPEHGGVTQVGADCLFMAHTHAAHDCVVGDSCVVANNTHIGGHVTVGEQVWFGGAVAVHQWCRIGPHAFVGGGSILVADVIPFGSVVGNHAHLAGLNVVGLKRRGFSRETIRSLRSAYRMLYAKEGTFSERLEDTAATFAETAEVMQIVDFIRSSKNRALCLPR
ncbi:MAG: acyl-ACP--UDP-N-acetylglucosamine O-acyltransferase [Hyphomonas sp.]|jgi:UDP-N-acetylglucosamine acyltransferase|nr:acyl-ACP--UDP-N-acetylglucosamine O-acyltransferase [Alphaproteobacteria bacterium]MCR9225362.1 acyl-ACP--UDP-N-acetylglucosamine O-acyltransferase [Hyphomonas sp.]